MNETLSMAAPDLPTLAQLECPWGTAAGKAPADFALAVLEAYAQRAQPVIDEAYAQGLLDGAAPPAEEEPRDEGGEGGV